MATDIVDFEASAGAIDGLLVITVKQVTDERGTVRELFRRTAFEAIGVTDIAAFQQINVTESSRGVIRGMHAEQMTKLLTLAAGEAFGAFVDTRLDSATYGRVETVDLRRGVQVLVPSGVANGFQTISEVSQYVYCFDEEWRHDMPGIALNPLDPALGIDWPIAVDANDVSMLSTKDRTAPAWADVKETA